jgi:hypothetical protein
MYSISYTRFLSQSCTNHASLEHLKTMPQAQFPIYFFKSSSRSSNSRATASASSASPTRRSACAQTLCESLSASSFKVLSSAPLLTWSLYLLNSIPSLVKVSPLSRRVPIFLSLLPDWVGAALVPATPLPLAMFLTRELLWKTHVFKILEGGPKRSTHGACERVAVHSQLFPNVLAQHPDQ